MSELIIKNRSLPAEVSDLHILRETLSGTWVVFSLVFLGVIAAAAAYLAFLPPVYRAEALVMIPPQSSDPFNRDVSPPSTELVRSQMEIIQSPTTQDHVIDGLGLDKDAELAGRRAGEGRGAREAARESVARRLDVGSDGRSWVIKIAFESRDPNKAARIANAFATRFIVEQRENKVEAAQAIRDSLVGRLNQLRQSAGAERKAEDFRRQNNLVMLFNSPGDAEASMGVTVASRQASELARTEAEMQGRSVEAQARWAQSLRDPDGTLSSAALSSPVIQNLLIQEAGVRQSLASAQTRRGPDNPEVKQLQNQLQSVTGTLSGELKRIRQSLSADAATARASEAGAARAIARLKAQVGSEMDVQTRYRTLARDAQQKRALFDELAGQVAHTAEHAVAQVPAGVIASFATPPHRPKGKKAALVGGFAVTGGAIIALVAAVMTGLARKRFVSSGQMARATGLPVITSRHPAETTHDAHVLVGRRLVMFAHRRSGGKSRFCVTLLRAPDVAIPESLSWRWAEALAQQGARVAILAEPPGPAPVNRDQFQVLEFASVQEQAESAVDMNEIAAKLWNDVNPVNVLLVEAGAEIAGIPELGAALPDVMTALVADASIRRDQLMRQIRDMRERGVQVDTIIRLT